MELQSLRLLLTDADLNTLVERFLPRDAPVTGVRITLADGLVHLAGTYPTRLLSVPFATTWEPSIMDGKARIRLTGVKVVGLPAGMLRGLFLNGFRQAAAQSPGVSLEDETLVVDLDRLLASRGIPVRSSLKSLRCTAGLMIVEG